MSLSPEVKNLPPPAYSHPFLVNNALCDINDYQWVELPTIRDAISSFKGTHGKNIPYDYFDRHSLYWIDDLPFCEVEWFVEKLGITEDFARQWSNHLVGMYNEYTAGVELVFGDFCNSMYL